MMFALQESQSALHPTSPQASLVADLWWWMLAVGGGVWIAVIVATIWVARTRGQAATTNGQPNDAHALVPVVPGRERHMLWAISALTGLTVAILVAFLATDFMVGRKLVPDTGSGLKVEVIGRQWWWELDYYKGDPGGQLVTASELHVPVGTTVTLQLKASDVIHSLWLPNMQGKRDMIPGHDNTLQFRADTAGVYRGQCAEFCGLQHAKMGLLLVAESEADYRRWLAAERAPSVAPATPAASTGLQVFEARSCALCHAIRGTKAAGQVAPDLTHIASRRTLASAAIANTRANMERWIVVPDSIKPGTHMPSTPLTQTELQALLTYLGTLR